MHLHFNFSQCIYFCFIFFHSLIHFFHFEISKRKFVKSDLHNLNLITYLTQSLACLMLSKYRFHMYIQLCTIKTNLSTYSFIFAIFHSLSLNFKQHSFCTSYIESRCGVHTWPSRYRAHNLHQFHVDP